MKDIKFRLIKNNKIMGFEKHKLLTDPITKKKNVYIYHSRTGHELSWHEITMCPKEYIAHDNKNQFTGLHDKNGKEIYESDIVKFTSKYGWIKASGEPMLDRWGVVGFEPGYFALYENNDENAYFVLDFVEEWGVEIIGNIYENKELLHDTTTD